MPTFSSATMSPSCHCVGDEEARSGKWQEYQTMWWYRNRSGGRPGRAWNLAFAWPAVLGLSAALGWGARDTPEPAPCCVAR